MSVVTGNSLRLYDVSRTEKLFGKSWGLVCKPIDWRKWAHWPIEMSSLAEGIELVGWVPWALVGCVKLAYWLSEVSLFLE